MANVIDIYKNLLIEELNTGNTYSSEMICHTNHFRYFLINLYDIILNSDNGQVDFLMQENVKYVEKIREIDLSPKNDINFIALTRLIYILNDELEKSKKFYHFEKNEFDRKILTSALNCIVQLCNEIAENNTDVKLSIDLKILYAEKREQNNGRKN